MPTSLYRAVKSRLSRRPQAQTPRAAQGELPRVTKPKKADLKPASREDLRKVRAMAQPKQLAVKSTVIPNYARPVARGKDFKARLLQSLAGDTVAEIERDLFDAQGTKRDISPQRKDDIRKMHETGAALPVAIAATDGHQLKGNFISARGSNLKESEGKPDLEKPVVLLLTGSGGSAEDQGMDMAKFYRESGASCLSVNYRGFGESDDVPPSEKGLVDDAQDMFEYLLKLGYKPEQIVIHGYSMGGAVAALIEKNNEAANPDMKLRGAVYDRPMTSVKEAAEVTLSERDDDGNRADLVSRKLGPGVAQAAVGFKGTKKAILASNPERPRLLATDTSSHVGVPGEKMRAKLDKRLDKIEGQASGGDHFDHQSMLNTNEQGLLGILHPKGEVLTDQEDAYDAATKVY